jgi:hypothetical protein
MSLPPGPGVVLQSSMDRIIAFVVGADGHLHDLYYDGGWIWEDQGTPPGESGATRAINSPCAIYQPTLDRVVAFVVANDGHLYDKYWDGAQWRWEDLGKPTGANAIYSPAACYQVTLDRIVVFVLGDNGHFYDFFFDGAGWVCEDQGSPHPSIDPRNPLGIYTSPCAIYQPTLDRVSAFVVGINGHLYNLFFGGGGGTWADLANPGGEIGHAVTGENSSPGVTYQAPLDRIVVVVDAQIGPNHSTYIDYYDGQKWVWNDVGVDSPGPVFSPVAVYQTALDRLSAYGGSDNGRLYSVFYNAQTQNWDWRDHGLPPGMNFGTVMSRPGVVYQDSLDRIVVFVMGSNGHLYDLFFDGNNWVWEDQGTPS